jgi:hypothetical protein
MMYMMIEKDKRLNLTQEEIDLNNKKRKLKTFIGFVTQLLIFSYYTVKIQQEFQQESVLPQK